MLPLFLRIGLKNLHLLFVESFFQYLPVEKGPEGGEVGGTAVLVIEVVGVLPHVEGQNRLVGGVELVFAGAKRVVGSGFLSDQESAVFLF